MRRTPENEEKRQRIIHMYVNGMPQQDIANELDMEQSEVSMVLKKSRAEIDKQTALNMDEFKLKVVGKLDYILDESLTAWEKSKSTFKSTTTSYRMDKNGEPVPSSKCIKEELRYGDPKYLDQANKALNRKAAILGLNAPEKIESSVIMIDVGPAEGVDEDKM